ncbi:MAG: FRG domain-containing protein [Ruminococcaceae bacterium]|nr:FRG domain-containing protein [Oscillospiraceae bacterium]
MKNVNPFLSKIENELDFDFRLETKRIESLDDFGEKILKPYEDGRRIFFRGERKNSITRPLLPTLFRDKDDLVPAGRFVSLVDSDFIVDYYRKMTNYYRLYRDIIGEVERDNLYSFLAFSQHYMGISPLIDFSKSPYPALSFALKDRKEYDEDILLYTLEIKDDVDFTDSMTTANRWLRDYSVLVFRDNARPQLDFTLENPLNALADYKKIHERFGGSTFLEMNTPHAKLIDVPTNDLMLYQQGVFLLLDDFSLMGKTYLTKQIRDDFTVKKWLINKNICPDLLDLLLTRYPYYAYRCIMDLNKVADGLKNQ